MKTNKTAILACALMVLAPVTADAQLGNIGKRLKNKAKNKVEQTVRRTEAQVENKVYNATVGKVENAVDNAVVNTQNKVQQDVNSAMNNGEDAAYEIATGKKGTVTIENARVPDWNKKYKLSKDAKKGDKWLRDGSRASGLTIEQAHAAYEQLDPEAFPLQPYYDFPSYYVLDTDDDWNGDDVGAIAGHMGVVLGNTSMSAMQMPYERIADRPGVNGSNANSAFAIPVLERGRYKWVTAFICDPANSKYFDHYCQTLFFEDIRSRVRATFEAPAGGVVDESTNLHALPRWSESSWRRRNIALTIAAEVVPIDWVVNEFKHYWNVANSTDNTAQQRAMFGTIAHQIGQLILQHHKQYKTVSNDPEIMTLMQTGDQKLVKLWNAIEEEAIANADPIDMPASVKMDAATTTKFTNLVRADRSNLVEVRFTSNQWRAFKDTKWPYRHTMDVVNGYMVTKEGDNYFVTNIQMRRSVPNGIPSYTIEGKKRKVNYKPAASSKKSSGKASKKKSRR